MTNDLPTGWQEVRLGDVCVVVGGGTPSTKEPKYWDGDVAWLSPRDLSGYKNKYISKGRKNITDLGLKKSSAKLLPKNTVLISSRAPIGYVVIAQKDICTNQGFKSLILNKDQVPEFYYYWVLANNDLLQRLGTGCTFKEISGSVIKNIEINIPQKGEQERIAGILSSLDDKIENNRGMNETLESMAQAMFKSWFVDFEPVHALMKFNKGESTHKTKSDLAKSLNMTEQTLSQLPDTFNNDGLPTGWEMKSLGDVCDNFDSKRIPLSKKQRNERIGSIPYYGATSIIGYVDEPIFSGEYVLMGEDGSVEKPDGTPFVQLIDCDCWVNNHAHVLRAKYPISNIEIYLSLQMVKIAPFMTGAVQAKLSQTNMNKISYVYSTDKIHKIFMGSVTVLFNQIKQNNQEIQTLTKTRDTLLPQLINGKIRV